MSSALSGLKTIAKSFPIAILLYEGGEESLVLLLPLPERRGESFALCPPHLQRRAKPFPLPSFSREEERVLSASPSSLEEESSLLFDQALLRRGEESLAICLPLQGKKRLPCLLPSPSRERGGDSLALCPLSPKDEGEALPHCHPFLERGREPCLPLLPLLDRRGESFAIFL